MAKNTNGGGGAPKSKSAEEYAAIRRAKKASQRHGRHDFGSGDLFGEIRGDRQKSRPDRNAQSTRREEAALLAERQSVEALEIIAKWTMSDNARLIAVAVAKAFVDAVKTADMKKTAVAKAKVQKVWDNSPALQERVAKKELVKGLRIGGAALVKAGNDVYGKSTQELPAPIAV